MGGVEQPPRRNIFYVFLVCLAMAGVQFVYSIQFAVGGPLFVQNYKVPNNLVSILLTTSGALSGFIMQPIIGVYSDSCTSRFGRRRPFLLGGTIFCVLGLFVVGNSVQLGEWLGDNVNGDTMHDHRHGFGVALLFLWVINISVNVMQGPARSIIADVLPADQHQQGNAVLTLTSGLAAVFANAIGAQFLMQPNPYRILFMIGCGFTSLCVLPTLLVAKEVPYVITKVVTEKQSFFAPFKKIGVSFITMPNVVVRIFAVFFCSWASYTPFMIYTTTYFANNVKHAYSDTDAYGFQKGVQLGMYALAVFAVVSTLWSIVLAAFVHRMGVKATYFVSQNIATICYVGLWLCSILNIFDGAVASIVFAIALTALVAINFTSFNSIPYALLSDSVPNADVGLYMGVLNAAVTVSQLVTSSIITPIIKHENNNVAWGIGFGAIVSILATILVPVLRSPAYNKKLSVATVTEETPLMN